MFGTTYRMSKAEQIRDHTTEYKHQSAPTSRRAPLMPCLTHYEMAGLTVFRENKNE
jgi:hypothetical protein